MKTEEIVKEWAKTRGYRAAVGSVSLLEVVRNGVRKRHEAGEIEAGFYRDNLDIFTYLDGVPLENPRSVILVAVPMPAYVLAFTVGDKRIETILPPTYVRYRKTFAEDRDNLA